MLTSLYGLRVRCALPMPGTPLDDGGDADVVVHVGERPPGAAHWREAPTDAFYVSEREPGHEPTLVADRPGDAGILRLRYAEGIRFHVSARGDEVWCDWVAPMVDADAVAFLLGPVMGSILRRRGVVALHASAVVIGAGAYAFLGPGGSGKSTLAAAFGLAGRPLLTEDVLALHPVADGWLAAPAYRGIRLWDDSAAMVLRGATLAPATPSWPKLDLPLDRHGLPFAPHAVPLRGMFVLDDVVAPGEPPRLSPLATAPLLVELIANVYANYVADRSELARELHALRPIAAHVRGWRFAPSAGRDGLSESCRAIESAVG